MSPKKNKFMDMDEDWIHTEVLGQRKKGSSFVSNGIILIVLVCALILLIVSFQGMFKSQDLSSLENLEQLQKQAKEQNVVIDEEKEEEPVIEEVVYIVESGDTLAYIGGEFNVEWQKIAERNGIEEPYDLEVGQELIIPGVMKEKTEEKAADEEDVSANPVVAEDGTYVVKEGDTLAGVGYELGIAWEDIAELNNIEPPYSLDVGQVLSIPAE